jgi:PIN domain nuclease of toxin-antitoxin system
MLNLDTHILLHTLSGSLTPKERRLVEKEDLCISDIVLWEIAKLTELGRIEITWNETFHRFLNEISVIPISYEIAKLTMSLDFSSDPADEIIASTSIQTGYPLLTRDKAILKSKLVPFAKL